MFFSQQKKNIKGFSICMQVVMYKYIKICYRGRQSLLYFFLPQPYSVARILFLALLLLYYYFLFNKLERLISYTHCGHLVN